MPLTGRPIGSIRISPPNRSKGGALYLVRHPELSSHKPHRSSTLKESPPIGGRVDGVDGGTHVDRKFRKF